MATESPIRMFESDESKKWLTSVDPVMFSSPFSTVSGQDRFTKLLKESSVVEEQSRMGPSRSGSAPPTVEGSIAALRTFMDQKNSTLTNSRSEFLECDSEERMRSDPAYIAYYYANVNLNPRLPPPLISKENSHLVRLIRGGGMKKVAVADGLLATHREEPEEDMSSTQTFSEPKQNFMAGTDMVSAAGEDRAEPGSVKGENDHVIDTVSTTDRILKMLEQSSCSSHVHEDVDGRNIHAVASVSHSGFCSTTSRCPENSMSEDYVSARSNIGSDMSVVESRMKSLDVSTGSVTEDSKRRLDNMLLHDQNTRFLASGSQSHVFSQGMHPLQSGIEKLAADHPKLPTMQSFMHNQGLVPPLYATSTAYMNSANVIHPSLLPSGFPSSQYAPGGFSTSSGHYPLPLGGFLQNNTYPLQINAYPTMGFFKAPMEPLTGEINAYRSQMLYPNKHYVQHEVLVHPFTGPHQGRYVQRSIQEPQRALQHKLVSENVAAPAPVTNYKEVSHPTTGNLTNEGQVGVRYYGYPPNSYYGYPPSVGLPPFAVPPPGGPEPPISGFNHPGLGNDPTASQFSPKNPDALSHLKGQSGTENSDDCKRNSFLELLKSSSSKKLELSDISSQIVEFSTDQHGSRFIQQKLEHCSTDVEKDSVFKEVLPHASKLMIDVFGNYVIQKFFEHGTLEHRRQLGEQLTGQVLSLSLQMYGCRVIQKALEVIELDQKVKLVQELDGHVMRCVHDQNGNHVIQKCIESVPAEKIGFILSSFHGQVAALSSHPYGCRVIQRVLEHCSDEKISRSIVDEILESACTLAQDPYGNYVTQHILEMGKPHERSQIIQKLTGKFIQMSQLKYASNVVEKCLKYGNAAERDLIIEEFIAETDNNDALLTMIKDQFGNYVVQKIFDMGTEKQKAVLLNCLQSHLLELKRFTYAKQIVSRYEQLTEDSSQDQS